MPLPFRRGFEARLSVSDDLLIGVYVRSQESDNFLWRMPTSAALLKIRGVPLVFSCGQHSS